MKVIRISAGFEDRLLIVISFRKGTAPAAIEIDDRISPPRSSRNFAFGGCDPSDFSADERKKKEREKLAFFFFFCFFEEKIGSVLAIEK